MAELTSIKASFINCMLSIEFHNIQSSCFAKNIKRLLKEKKDFIIPNIFGEIFSLYYVLCTLYILGLQRKPSWVWRESQQNEMTVLDTRCYNDRRGIIESSTLPSLQYSRILVPGFILHISEHRIKAEL